MKASIAGRTAVGTFSVSTFSRILHLGFLLLSLLLCLTQLGYGQEQEPLIVPGERKTSRKKDLGPRAVGLLQLGKNGKASLVPIAILINGKFWDATAYKADPVPMALDPGNVYEVEQTGSSLGLFTINSALHSNAQNSAAPWLGAGSWRPAGSEEPAKDQHANATPVGIDDTDAPPRLTHDVSKQNTPNPAPKSGSVSASGSAPSSGTAKPSTSSGAGDEPPRLTKPAETSAPPADAKPPAAGSSAPNDAKAKDAGPVQGNIPVSDSSTSEANRPRLRRGKPAESFADEDIPGYSRPGAAATSAPDLLKVVAGAAANPDIKLIPAISDAGGPPPHPFKFEWVKGDEEDRHKQMIDLAKTELRAYLAAHAKAEIPAKPARTPARRKTTVSPEPILENVQMTAFDLWNTNQPVIVMTATAHMPASSRAAQAEGGPDLQYSMCLVTYPDIYNNLHKLYSGITDRFHLDVTPHLDFIDVVDADGDGRGELLFRETSDVGTGWILYRATADKLWKMFDSLNPE